MACSELFGVIRVAFEYTEHKQKIFGKKKQTTVLSFLLFKLIT